MMVSRQELHDKSTIYSWATKVDFMLNNVGGFIDLDNAKVSLLWDQDYILTLKPRKLHPQLEKSGAKGYRLTINAAQTECDAENLGTKLAYTLLCIAIDRDWGLALSWPDSPLPCRVIDRTASTGTTVEGFGFTTNHLKVADFVKALDTSFARHHNVPYSLLLSMELCASSRFEINDRSRLIMLVSAFEALARQQDLSTKLGSIVDDLKKIVETSNLEDDGLKSSLIGQIEGFKRESVLRATRRLLADVGLSREDRHFFSLAYQARSKIVHEGQRVPELDAMNNRLDSLLKVIYRFINNDM